jgi:hypothetical protein
VREDVVADGDTDAEAPAAQAADQQKPQAVSDRFPELKPLEAAVERAKLEKELAEARAATSKTKPLEETVARAKLEKELAETRAATSKAKLPSLDFEVAKDTVAFSDKTTGLARAFVQMDTVALADDIADLALDAARGHTTEVAGRRRYHFRVTTDPAVFADVDVYRVIEGQLTHLENLLAAHAAQCEGGGPEEGEAEADVQATTTARPDRGHTYLLAPNIVSSMVGTGLQALGAVSKLFVSDFQLSGAEAKTDDLGFDAELAHYLTSKRLDGEQVTVELERFTPSPPAAILARLWQVAESAEEELGPLILEQASVLAEATAGAETTKTAIAAIDAQILELTKNVPTTHRKIESEGQEELQPLHAQHDALAAEHALQERIRARAQSKYDRLNALATAITEFVSHAFAPGADGQRPAALRAARAEALVAPEGDRDTLIMYARLIAAGIDQAVETRRLRGTRFRALAGASAEFALLTREGSVLASGARSAMQASAIKLNKPDALQQRRPGYVGLERKRWWKRKPLGAAQPNGDERHRVPPAGESPMEDELQADER